MRRRSEYEEDELAWRIALACFLIAAFAQFAKLLIEIFAIAG